MTRLKSLRGRVFRQRMKAVVTAIAAVMIVGLIAQPAGAEVTFADRTSAHVQYPGSCDLGRVMFNVVSSTSSGTWYRVWVYDNGTRRYWSQPISDWTQIPYGMNHSQGLLGVRGNLSFLVEFTRWVGYWDRGYEWVWLQSGGGYGQAFNYCTFR
jgi:hypothetical protein